MFDHGLDTHNRITLGTTIFPFENKMFSITADGQYNIESGIIETQLRGQFQF